MTDPLVLLVLIWAVLLLPSAFRSRRSSPHVTVGGFERAMSVLSSEVPGGGRHLLVPSDASRIVHHDPTDRPSPDRTTMRSPSMSSHEDPLIARRRSRFVRALAGTAATLVLAVVVGGWVWPLFVVVAGGTAGYATILRRLKLQRDEARQVVRELDLRGDEVAEAPRHRVAVGAGAVGGAAGTGGVAPTESAGTVRLRRWED